MVEKLEAGKRQIPSDLKPLLADWFNPDKEYRNPGQESDVSSAIAWILTGKVLKLNDNKKPELSVGSIEDLAYRRRVISCANDILKEVLEEFSVEELAHAKDNPAANAVSYIVDAFRSGLIKDGGFWNGGLGGDNLKFMKAQDQLFVGMELLALELVARYDLTLQVRLPQNPKKLETGQTA